MQSSKLKNRKPFKFVDKFPTSPIIAIITYLFINVKKKNNLKSSKHLYCG